MQPQNLGEKIRMFRNLKGYSQKGLAKASGISQSQISYIEKSKNKKKCDAILLGQICNALQISEDELQGFGETKNEVFNSVIKDLNKKDTLLYDAAFENENVIPNLLSTIELLTRVIASYKLKLEAIETTKKIALGKVS